MPYRRYQRRLNHAPDLFSSSAQSNASASGRRSLGLPLLAIHADFGHPERRDRSIVNARIGSS